MQIEQRIPCPRCGHPRVIRCTRNGYLCFQCRFGWSNEAEPRVAAIAPDPLAWCPAEQRPRLIAYRAAIRAGLYTDWPASTVPPGVQGADAP